MLTVRLFYRTLGNRQYFLNFSNGNIGIGHFIAIAQLRLICEKCHILLSPFLNGYSIAYDKNGSVVQGLFHSKIVGFTVS